MLIYKDIAFFHRYSSKYNLYWLKDAYILQIGCRNDAMLIKDNIKIVLETLNFSNEQKIDMCHEL